MSALASNLLVLKTLLKRELNEHRLLFLYMPLSLTLLAALAYVMWFMDVPTFPTFDPQSTIVRRFGQSYITALQNSRYAEIIDGMYYQAAELMLLVFWCSMAFYYLYTLYQQRANRSILFWNSMPVNDAQTIASKLLSGLVGCYAVYFLCLAVLDLFVFASVSVYGLFDANTAWNAYLIDEAPLWKAFPYAAQIPQTILWSLPVYGWLLLASAWARRAPFAWATGPWIVIIVIEVALTGKSRFLNIVVAHLFPVSMFQLGTLTYETSLPTGTFQLGRPVFDPVELAVSALLGCIFLVAAALLNRSDDT